MTEPSSTSTDEKLSLSELVDSLTGHEENAIEERFGAMPADLIVRSLSKLKRSLIFVAQQRKGDAPEAAYQHAMNMRLVDVVNLFQSDEEDADDAMPTDPDTDQGKDDSPSA